MHSPVGCQAGGRTRILHGAKESHKMQDLGELGPQGGRVS